MQTMREKPERPGGRPAIALLAAIVIAGAVGAGGCNKASKNESTTASPAAAGPENTAPIVTQAAWAPDALEELVAPIALYPDQLVGQILAAAVTPQEVMDAGNWLLENQTLKGDALDKAAQSVGFGPPMRALLQFPTIVDMMCSEFDWTKQLGSAFTSDQKGVLDAIQRLRASAAEVGNLKSSKEQTVETKSEGGQTYIEVKPADPKVVYVPQYDPAVVYTTPPAAAPAPTTTTTVVQDDDDDEKILGGLLLFGAGIALGAALNDDYYGYPHWGYGAVYMGPRPFYPPAYAYRPVYGGGFYPSYGYRPPANYVNHYGNTNVFINNNNNYYNRFDHNSNLRGGGNRSPLDNNRRDVGRDNRGRDANRNQVATRDVNRPGAGGRDANRPSAGTRDVQRNAGQQSWRGQSSYAGKKDGASSKVGSGGAGTRDTRTAAVDRGYGGSGRGSQTYKGSTRPGSGGSGTHAASAGSGTRAQTASRAASAPRAESRPSVDRPSASASRPSAGTAHTRDTALSGGSGSGSFERASSARGRASTHASSGGSLAASSGASRGSGGGGRSGGGAAGRRR